MFLCPWRQSDQNATKGKAFGNPACQKREFDKRYIYGIVRYGRKRVFLFVPFYMVRHYKTPVLLKRNTCFKFTKLVRYDALRYKVVFS